ncbi:uncharacterized protein [Clytia hemisphaerica]
MCKHSPWDESKNPVFNINTNDLSPSKGLDLKFIKETFKKFIGGNFINCSSANQTTFIPGINNTSEINLPDNLQIRGLSNLSYHQMCRNLSTGKSVFNIGRLNRYYYPIRNVVLENPHFFITKYGDSLTLLAVGELYFCGFDMVTRASKKAVLEVKKKVTTITIDGLEPEFKPSLIADAGIVNIKRFRNYKIDQMSRYNFNYLTDLKLSRNTKLTMLLPHGGDHESVMLVLRDIASNFKTRYNDATTSEIVPHKSIVSEMFSCCKDFLGVYFKLKMELVHLTKMLIPQYYHEILNPKWPWDEIVEDLTFKILLLRGSFKSGKSRKMLSSIHSQIIKLMKKYSIYEGMLVETIGSLTEDAKDLPRYLQPGSRIDAVLKYTNKLFAEIKFYQPQNAECISMQSDGWKDFNRLLSNLKQFSKSFIRRSLKQNKTCGKDTFMMSSITIKFNSMFGYWMSPTIIVRMVESKHEVKYVAKRLNLYKFISEILLR